MACKTVTLATLDARCDASMGGIKEVLIIQRDDVEAITSDATEKIDSITLKQGKKFVKWSFRRNTGSYTSTFEGDPTTGNSSVTTEVSLQFSRAEADKRLKIQSALNANAVVIVRDMYDNYLYLGEDNDVYVTACTMQSGTAASDLSGFNITFQDVADTLPKFIDTEKVDIDNLIAPAV